MGGENARAVGGFYDGALPQQRLSVVFVPLGWFTWCMGGDQ
jgi:hypothetical protein